MANPIPFLIQKASFQHRNADFSCGPHLGTGKSRKHLQVSVLEGFLILLCYCSHFCLYIGNNPTLIYRQMERGCQVSSLENSQSHTWMWSWAHCFGSRRTQGPFQPQPSCGFIPPICGKIIVAPEFRSVLGDKSWCKERWKGKGA